MARPWVKLYISTLHHAPTGRLSDAAYRAWITALLMAGERDADGEVGTVDDLAWQLRWSAEQVEAALSEMNGRIGRDGDVLRVRDWGEWQPPTTTAERVRKHRARQARNVAETLQGAKDVTNREEVDKEEEVDKKKKLPPAPNGAGKWKPVTDALAAVFGPPAVYGARGQALAPADKVIRVIRPPSGGDPAEAVKLLREWLRFEKRRPDWQQYLTAKNAHERISKWLAAREDEAEKVWRV